MAFFRPDSLGENSDFAPKSEIIRVEVERHMRDGTRPESSPERLSVVRTIVKESLLSEYGFRGKRVDAPFMGIDNDTYAIEAGTHIGHLAHRDQPASSEVQLLASDPHCDFGPVLLIDDHVGIQEALIEIQSVSIDDRARAPGSPIHVATMQFRKYADAASEMEIKTKHVTLFQICVVVDGLLPRRRKKRKLSPVFVTITLIPLPRVATNSEVPVFTRTQRDILQWVSPVMTAQLRIG